MKIKTNEIARAKFYNNKTNDMGVRTITITNERFNDSFTYGESHPFEVKYGRRYMYCTEEFIEELLTEMEFNGFECVMFIGC